MGKQQSKPLKPVERGADGKVKSGTPNPGGMTKEQRQARDALNQWLCADAQVVKGKEAYVRLLKADNPVIVKDFMDRVAGKVKEHVELSGGVERPLRGMTPEEILAALKVAK